MKRILILLVFLFSFQFIGAQNLNLKLLDQISTISFVDMDRVMVNGYGFKKMKDEGSTITYMNVFDNDFDSAIVIDVASNPNSPRHLLTVHLGPNFSIRKVKSDLVNEGYLYEGLNKIGLHTYTKNNVHVLVSDKPNDAGAHQIMMFHFKQD